MSVQILHVWPLHKLEGLGAEVGAAVSPINISAIIDDSNDLFDLVDIITATMSR